VIKEMALAWATSSGYKVVRNVSQNDFLHTAKSISQTSSIFSYEGGSYARASVGEAGLVDVGYTDQRHDLLVHNEMAYLRDYPSYIAFYAETPATGGGGETLLCDGRRVWRDLSKFSRNILGEGQLLTYSQIYGNGTLQYQNRNDYMALWQDVFGVDNREEAQKRAESLGYVVEWSDEHEMEVSYTRSAVRYDMPSLDGDEDGGDGPGDGCFFDQIVCCHSKNCTASARDGRPHFQVMLADKEEESSTAFTRSDIPSSVMEEVEELTEQHTDVVALEKGDMVVVDNRIVKHGRRAFNGNRVMIAALLA
jgi:hypothetical protein